MAMSTPKPLPPDLWLIVAKLCVETHELRTVCNIAHDLCSLQSTCKSSSQCAKSLWQTVRNLCHKSSRAVGGKRNVAALKEHFDKNHVVLSTAELSKAVNLRPDMLVVYVQLQIDKCVNILHSAAMKTYHLDKPDLATCQRVQKVVQTQPGQSTLHKRHRHKYSKQVGLPAPMLDGNRVIGFCLLILHFQAIGGHQHLQPEVG